MNYKPLLAACFTLALSFPAKGALILVGFGNTTNNGNLTTYNFASSLITDYNTANNPDLPSLPTYASLDPYPRTETGSGPKMFSFTFTSTPAYLLLKWGGADKNPQEVQLYYADSAGTYDFTAPIYLDNKGKEKQNGLSHYDLFKGTGTDDIPKEVPDGGATFVTLGLALLGLGSMRRFMIKKA